jgi:hypothetical protein
MGLFSQKYSKVPPFNAYYPSLDEAGPEQQAFYYWMVEQFKKEKTPDVQGNLSYLFIFIYDVINYFISSKNYSNLSYLFDFLRNGYGDTPKLKDYLNSWQGDAALFIENWSDAWEYKRKSILDFDFVLNVRSKCEDTSLSVEDLHHLLGSDNGLTQAGRERMNDVNKEADNLLSSFHDTNNRNIISAFCEEYARRELKDDELDKIADECEYLVSPRKLKNAYEKQQHLMKRKRELFMGARMANKVDQKIVEIGQDTPMSGSVMSISRNPTICFVTISPAIALALGAYCKRLLRESENIVREKVGLPRIGEGWVSETELYILIQDSLPGIKVVQHARPHWLIPQHLDVYLPDFKIGVEYQGAQHLAPVDYFGGEKAFTEQQRRDERKKKLCRKNGCTLIEVFQGYNIFELKKVLREKIERC